MKNSKNYLPILITLVLLSAALASPAQNQQPSTNSAPNSPTSATPVSSPHVSKGSTEPVSSSDTTGASPKSEPPASAGGLIPAIKALSACSTAADELIASRTLIDALEKENASLKARHQTDQQMIDLLTELSETRKAESEALRSTVAAKNDTITAKDAVITSQGKLIDTLKRKKSSPWKRLGDVLIGVGLGTVL